MFRVAFSHGLTSVTSRFSSNSVSSSSFHTAVILRAARRTASSKKKNLERLHQRKAKEKEQKPSFVLGTVAWEEAEKWNDCDLAKCLVNPHKLNGPPTFPPPTDTEPYSLATLPSEHRVTQTIGLPEDNSHIIIPKNTNYGIDTPDRQMLFQELPFLCATKPMTISNPQFSATSDVASSPEGSEEDSSSPTAMAMQISRQVLENVKKEKRTSEAFARVIDLVNANAKGIAYENKRRIVQEFSGPENSFDPGRVEVQAALLTYKIRNLWNHLTTFKRDVGNRRSLLKLIHQRAKILRYLKRLDQNRYDIILDRLALEPKSVEGELTL